MNVKFNKSFLALLSLIFLFFQVSCVIESSKPVVRPIQVTAKQFLKDISGNYSTMFKGAEFTANIQEQQFSKKKNHNNQNFIFLRINWKYKNNSVISIVKFTQKDISQTYFVADGPDHFIDYPHTLDNSNTRFFIINREEFFAAKIAFQYTNSQIYLKEVILWKTGFAPPLLKKKFNIRNFTKK